MGAQGVEFRLLGPLEVERDGRVLPVGGRRQRALLTFLLLHANTVVARDRLIDALWGEDPPETAANALQVAVHTLRKLLGADRIVTRGPGYLLRVEAGELDLQGLPRARGRAGGPPPPRCRRNPAPGTRALDRPRPLGPRRDAVRGDGARAARGAAPGDPRGSRRRRPGAQPSRRTGSGARSACRLSSVSGTA